MKKKTLALSAALLLGMATQASAQVSDVNFVVAPTVSYTLWNNKLNLGDTPFYGVRAGFSFGPLVELRGSYEHSYDLKSKLQGSGWRVINTTIANRLDDNSKVKIERFGGDIKFNLWSNATLTPYLTAGAGVLKLRYDDVVNAGARIKEEQLYGTFGAGVKINLARRIALSLEARDMLFKVDDTNQLLAAGVDANKAIHNFGASASLDIYLGGSNYSKDAVTRAYRRTFAGGWRGLKFAIEPGVAYINFRGDSRFNDTWLLGGSAGVDFSSVFGVRGFYYRETKEADKLRLKMGKNLEMYGGNFVARLNVARGVTPYLNLGAGYLKVDRNNYVDVEGQTGMVKSGWFGLGGAGVELPLHHYVALFGSANAMILRNELPKNYTSIQPSNVNINWMFQGGLRINIGARARSGEYAYTAYANRQVEAERNARMDEINELRASYDARIAKLNKQIAKATEELDAQRVAMLKQERDDAERARLEVAHEEVSIVAPALTPVQSPAVTTLTEEQLERIITRVLAATEATAPAQQTVVAPAQQSTLSDLDKILLISALRNGQLQPAQLLQYSSALAPQVAVQGTEPLVLIDGRLSESKELNKLNPERIESIQIVRDSKELLARGLNGVSGIITVTTKRRGASATTEQSSTAATQPQLLVVPQTGVTTALSPEASAFQSGSTEPTVYQVTTDADGKTKLQTLEIEPAGESYLKLRSVAPYAGIGFGDATTFNLGVRANLQMGKSLFYLSPEFYLGLGGGTGFGLGANVVYDFSRVFDKTAVSPYLGLGLGYSHLGGENRFGLTGLVGVAFDDILGGRFFVDYSLRPAFKNHHFSAGYTFTL